MTNLEVIYKWFERKKGKTKNLETDGRSVFSYGHYEIARHVGQRVTFLRHPDEGYSNSTRRHIFLIWREGLWKNIRQFRIKGSHKKGISASYMGQPDWSWVSLLFWYDRWKSNTGVLWPGNTYIVKIRKDICISSDEVRKINISKFKRLQQTAALCELLTLDTRKEHSGILIYRNGIRGKNAVDETPFSTPLRLLTRVEPCLSVSEELAIPYTAGPEWLNHLFFGINPPDVRAILGVELDVINEHGAPPEPIIPDWYKRIKK